MVPVVNGGSKFVKKNDTAEKGLKYDEGKLRWSLLPLLEVKEILRVLEFGAKRYGANNWKQVRPARRYLDAAYRHLVAYTSGEKIDPESGISHLAHLGCNILFLLWFERNGINLDEEEKTPD
jgi:hypothetical protein